MTRVIDRRLEKNIKFVFDRYGKKTDRTPEMYEKIEIYPEKVSMHCKLYDLFICNTGKYITTYYGHANDGIVNSK